MACTALAGCEYHHDGHELVNLDGVPVANYWSEIDRRGRDHVDTCPGIYPTRYVNGEPRYDGLVCGYGREADGGVA
jgi:hypothetical protein